MKSVKSIMIVLAFISMFCISNALYGDSFVSKTTNKDNVDFAKVAKKISQNEQRPPRLIHGDPLNQGIDVSCYFSNVIKKGDDVFKIKEKLIIDGFLINWRDENGNIVRSQEQKTVQLSAVFIFYTGISGIISKRDRFILLNISFDDMYRVTKINARYITSSI